MSEPSSQTTTTHPPGGDPNSARAGLATRYPSPEGIRLFFRSLNLGHPDAFDMIAPDVNWTVMGTHPCAGEYKSLTEFTAATHQRIRNLMKPPGLQLKVRNVIGGGDSPWACVELVGTAECKNGMPFENCYCWMIRYDEDGKVREVRAYLDSQLVTQAIEENEEGYTKVQKAPISLKKSVEDPTPTPS